MKRKNYCLGLITFFVFLGIQNVYCEIPTSVEKTPIYKGATLIEEESSPKEYGLNYGILRIYEVEAPIEEVVKFYENLLQIQKRNTDYGDPYSLAIGGMVKPIMQIDFHDDSQYIDADYGRDGVSARGWIKKALQKRTKDKEGFWIANAMSIWFYRDSENSLVELEIMIDDKSINEDLQEYHLKTEIRIRVVCYEYSFS